MQVPTGNLGNAKLKVRGRRLASPHFTSPLCVSRVGSTGPRVESAQLRVRVSRAGTLTCASRYTLASCVICVTACVRIGAYHRWAKLKVLRGEHHRAGLRGVLPRRCQETTTWAPGGDVVRAAPVPKTLGLRHPRIRLRSRLPRVSAPVAVRAIAGLLTHRAIILARYW